MKKLLFVLLGLVAVGRLVAAEPPGFRIKVLPTIQYHFDDIWNWTPTGRQPRVAMATKLAPGQPVHVHVLASSIAADADGASHVDFSVRLFRPDGAVGYEQDGLVLVPAGGQLGRDLLAKAQNVAVMSINEGDPMGAWRLAVEASDRIGGVSARDEVVLEVDPVHLTESLPEGKAAPGWMMAYHFNLRPQQLMSYLRDLTDHPPWQGAPPSGFPAGLLRAGFAGQPMVAPAPDRGFCRRGAGDAAASGRLARLCAAR
ncbi:MAG: hypothetical protein ACO3DQ_05355 [Cephaloticoccus sp.]